MKTTDIETNSKTSLENQAATTGDKLLFEIGDAAARLSISVVSVRKLIRQRRLRRVPNFRKVLINEAELRRFAAATE